MKKCFTVYLLLFALIINTSAQENKKLLPSKIHIGNTIIHFNYDDQNRFIELIDEDGESVTIDSIYYTPYGFKIIQNYYLSKEDYKTNNPLERKTLHHGVYITNNKNEQTIALREDYKDSEPNAMPEDDFITTFKLNNADKPSSMEIKNEGERTVYFNYDERNNISNWKLSDHDLFGGFYLHMENNSLSYDDKNGIFKHVTNTPLPLLYLVKMPYLLFLENNVIHIGHNMDDYDNTKFVYEYNKEGYPISLKSIYEEWNMKVEYTEAK